MVLSKQVSYRYHDKRKSPINGLFTPFMKLCLLFKLIQTLGRRDLSGCFLIHICAFYSSYSSYSAFLCTSAKIFRAKIEPSKPFITYANIIETANNNNAIMSKYTAILKNLYFRLTISEL